MAIAQSLSQFTSDIKISHSIFALPFALSSLWINKIELPNVPTLLLLLVCMVSARSYAMGMNRLLDAKIDGLNPRTQSRAIPAGRLSVSSAWFWVGFFAVVFLAASFVLNPLAGWCAFIVLVILGLYPFWKKWSWLTHWYLGICLGLSPMAVEVALNSQLSLNSVIVGFAIALWTAGFDILYALQDRGFDRESGLQSVPAVFGVKRSLWISRGCFIGMVFLLLWLGIRISAGWPYLAGVLVVASILAGEHWLIRDSSDQVVSKHLNLAFFNLNAAVSLVFLTGLMFDRWV